MSFSSLWKKPYCKSNKIARIMVNRLMTMNRTIGNSRRTKRVSIMDISRQPRVNIRLRSSVIDECFRAKAVKTKPKKVSVDHAYN